MPAEDLDRYIPKSSGKVEWTGPVLASFIRKVKSLLPKSSADIGWTELAGGSQGFLKGAARRTAQADGTASDLRPFTISDGGIDNSFGSPQRAINVKGGRLLKNNGEHLVVPGLGFTMPVGPLSNYNVWMNVNEGVLHHGADLPPGNIGIIWPIGDISITGPTGDPPSNITEIEQIWDDNIALPVVDHQHMEKGDGGNKINLKVDDTIEEPTPSFKINDVEKIFVVSDVEKLAADYDAAG